MCDLWGWCGCGRRSSGARFRSPYAVEDVLHTCVQPYMHRLAFRRKSTAAPSSRTLFCVDSPPCTVPILSITISQPPAFHRFCIYEVIASCWIGNPKNHPTFSQLRSQLDHCISARSLHRYLRLEEPYEQNSGYSGELQIQTIDENDNKRGSVSD